MKKSYLFKSNVFWNIVILIICSLYIILKYPKEENIYVSEVVLPEKKNSSGKGIVLGYYNDGNMSNQEHVFPNRSYLISLRDNFVDCVIVNFFGRPLEEESFIKSLKVFLDECLEFSVFVGFTYRFPQDRVLETRISDLVFLYNQVFSHPSLLRIDDKPFLFFSTFYYHDNSHFNIINSLLNQSIEFYYSSTGMENRHIVVAYEDGCQSYISYNDGDRFSLSSDMRTWSSLSELCSKRNLVFIPTICNSESDHFHHHDFMYNEHNYSKRSELFFIEQWKKASSINVSMVFLRPEKHYDWINNSNFLSLTKNQSFIFKSDVK